MLPPVSTLEEGQLAELLQETFTPLAGPEAWQLAAVAVAGGASATWLSGTGASQTGHFHIGSVTKTFTALALAAMAVEGRLSLDDPVSRYLPAASGAQTRLVDLASHTAGYPRVPRLVQWRMLLRLRDPYALVRDRHVDKALARLSRRPADGGQNPVVYSTFGYGVLSRALSAAAQEPFAALLRHEVLGPLGLTSMTADVEEDNGRVLGHDLSGNAVEDWLNPSLPGAGCLWASIDDMHRYLIANLEPESSPLRAAIELAHEPRQAAGPATQVGLGWLVSETDHGLVHWHNGGTNGFGAFVGFDRGNGVGVAVLCSRRHSAQLDDAARKALGDLVLASLGQ